MWGNYFSLKTGTQWRIFGHSTTKGLFAFAKDVSLRQARRCRVSDEILITGSNAVPTWDEIIPYTIAIPGEESRAVVEQGLGSALTFVTFERGKELTYRIPTTWVTYNFRDADGKIAGPRFEAVDLNC